MNRIDAWRMIERRAAGLDMKVRMGCHTVWATGITYLEAGSTLETVNVADRRGPTRSVSGDRRPAFIRQNKPSASPDTPSEFVPG
jgi:hypothetical protein